MQVIRRVLKSEGLFARALRGSAWTGSGHILSQFIRLASNLVLTRLLFPEAFGLMSLVTVLMVGVAMLSDVGIGLSVSQSKRGDDPTFLDTAWTMQVIRGVVIFALILLMAWPVGQFYGEPELSYLIPVAGIWVLISGFNPIRLETAGRHLLLGRVVLLDLISQIASIVVTIVCALIYPSVWSLVIGLILGAVIRLCLALVMIPGEGSRFRLDPSSAREILNFGKWIIPSTAFGYMLGQGDRLVLAAYISLEMLGIYNIGQFLAAAPLVLSVTIVGKVLLPVYRDYAERPSKQSAYRLRLMRLGLTGGTMTMLAVMALIAQPLVTLLYDGRYAQASAIVVLVALAGLPQALGLTYDRVALAAGDSRGFFVLTAFRGTAQTIALILGAGSFGLLGAIVAMGIAGLIGHLAVIWLAIKHRAWDPVHDAGFMAFAALAGGFAVYVNWDLLAGFHAMSRSAVP